MGKKMGLRGRRGLLEAQSSICSTSLHKDPQREIQDGQVLMETWSLLDLPWLLAAGHVAMWKAHYRPTRRSLPLLKFWAMVSCIKADIKP